MQLADILISKIRFLEVQLLSRILNFGPLVKRRHTRLKIVFLRGVKVQILRGLPMGDWRNLEAARVLEARPFGGKGSTPLSPTT
jgi:hypothetical protein